MSLLMYALLVFSAALEVGGDARVRKGLRGGSLAWVAMGCSALAVYGIVLNTARWDFSKLLGVYVGLFALVAVLVGKFFFQERVPASTWIGLGVIVLGGLIIQLGRGGE